MDAQMNFVAHVETSYCRVNIVRAPRLALVDVPILQKILKISASRTALQMLGQHFGNRAGGTEDFRCK